METVADVFAAFGPGATAKFAARFGVPYGTVAAMKRRGAIDGGYWHALAGLAVEHGVEGVTVEVLAKIHDRIGVARGEGQAA